MENLRQTKPDFTTEKLKEEPVKLYYYRTGGRVAVKLKWNKKTYTYRVGRGREVRLNRGNDCNEYPYIVSVSYIEDFLYQNGVRDEDMWVDPRSIDIFYSFRDKVSINLTPSFVATWWNYDCPDLYRHTPNKYRDTNLLGKPICHFSNKLVEVSFSADYIGDSITEEEVKALTNGYEHTRIYRTMKNVLEAKKINDEAKIAELREKVVQFDKKIQKVIDDHKNEIFDYVKNRYPYRCYWLPEPNQYGYNFHIDDDFGLDCGFIYIQTSDKEYTQNRELLRQIDAYVFPWMNISLPYPTQSVTLKKVQFDKAKEIVQKELGIELYAHMVLD